MKTFDLSKQNNLELLDLTFLKNPDLKISLPASLLDKYEEDEFVVKLPKSGALQMTDINWVDELN